MTAIELLDFARGPALWASVSVLVLASLWRVGAIMLLGSTRDLSEPRAVHTAGIVLRAIVARMLPAPQFRGGRRLAALNGYVYHVGLAVIAFGYLPHIRFVERLTGLAWPALPEPVVYVSIGITFVSLFIALMERLGDPVRRLLSGFDDYFSWFVVILPLVTGMVVVSQPYGPPAPPLYPLPLAFHLLSVELLFLWLPFGKLAHAFLVFASRAVSAAALARRGAAT